MVAFHTIKPGDRLYDCHRTKMGNTTMSRMGCWDVRVIEVDDRGALVSWNGNAPERWGIFRLTKLRRSPAKSAS